MINEGSPAVPEPERPTHRMCDLAFVVLLRVHFPDFFHADAELGDITVGIQLEPRDHVFGERTAYAFGQEYVFAMQFHPRLVTRPRRAIGFLPELASDHAFQATVVVPYQIGTGHAGKDFDAQFFGLLGQPPADIAHRYDVIAVVVHQGRQQGIGDAKLARLPKHIEVVFLDLDGDRCASVLPVWDQPCEA